MTNMNHDGIIGVMGVVSHNKLVLDSRSLSTARPYVWCSDTSVNDGDNV